MLDGRLTIYVCGLDQNQWVAKFASYLGATTSVKGDGTWEGVSEENIAVSTWIDRNAIACGDFGWKVTPLLTLIDGYRLDAKQETVAVTLEDECGFRAYFLPGDDARLFSHLLTLKPRE